MAPAFPAAMSRASFFGLFTEGVEGRTNRKRFEAGFRTATSLSSIRLSPAETRLKEGAHALDSDQQVGVFPCRGWVAPCERAPGSIRAAVSMSTRLSHGRMRSAHTLSLTS